VPIVFALDGDTIYTAVDAKPKTSTRLKRLANIAAESKVAVLVDHYDDDWSRLWWSRADGRARVVDGSEAARAIGLLVARHAQYSTAPPPGPVIAVDVERWTGWAASTSSLDP
jgi:PPOX class probable F420-dependent enzyme